MHLLINVSFFLYVLSRRFRSPDLNHMFTLAEKSSVSIEYIYNGKRERVDRTPLIPLIRGNCFYFSLDPLDIPLCAHYNELIMADFVHLHHHSEYSLLDGLSKLKDMVSQAKELGMKSLAITDHGNMYGTVYFYQVAKAAGIKPIIGCEIYMAQRTRFDKDPVLDKQYNHLI